MPLVAVAAMAASACSQELPAETRQYIDQAARAAVRPPATPISVAITDIGKTGSCGEVMTDIGKMYFVATTNDTNAGVIMGPTPGPSMLGPWVSDMHMRIVRDAAGRAECDLGS